MMSVLPKFSELAKQLLILVVSSLLLIALVSPEAHAVYYNIGAFWRRPNFTFNWPFTAGTDAQYSFGSSVELVNGVARLKSADQIDDDNTATGFLASGSGGTAVHTGTEWDSTNASLRLSQSGTPTNNSEIDASWAPQYSSIVGHWKLNGTIGSIANAAAITATVGTNGSASNVNGTGLAYAAGTCNQSVSLDGVDDYLNLGNFSGINNLSTTTWAAWVYRGSTAAQTFLYKSNGNSDAGWWIDFNSQQGPFLAGTATHIQLTIVYGTQNSRVATALLPPINTWFHLAITWDGAQTLTGIRIYVNGQAAPLILAGTSPSGNHASDAAVPMYLGAGNTGSNTKFTGKVDELAIWNRVLTAGEVAREYTRQSPKYSGSMVSRVLDAYSTGQSWSSFTWVPTLPYMKELPESTSENSTDYPDLVGSTGVIGDNDLMTGIAALYHLNEAAATAGAGNDYKDDSGTGNFGEAAGGVTFAQPGAFDRAAKFDGVDEYIDSGAPNVSGNDGISAWVFPQAFSSNNTVVDSQTSGNALNNQYNLYLDVNGKLNRYFTSACTSSTALPLAKWSHVASTYDGTNIRLYLDGILVGTCAQSKPSVTTAKMRIGGRNGTTNLFKGLIDEVSVWSRNLHAKEVFQLYRRGANRMKVQVRVCTASDCSDDTSGANWKGPDGTNQTEFSELNNNTAPLTLGGDVKNTLPSLLFSSFTSPVGTSRYFQYRVILESDDSSTECNYGSATWCSPVLESSTVGAAHYSPLSPTISGVSGAAFSSLASATETLGTSCADGVSYVLSLDQTNWYWWDGGWILSDSTSAKSNSAAAITAHAQDFRTQVGSGTLYFKAFLKSTGTNACELDEFVVKGQS